MPQISPEEYEKKNLEILDKLNSNQKITSEEENFFCSSLRMDLLPQFSFCDDFYFSKIFLCKRPEFPKEFNPLRSVDIVYYKKAVQDWNGVIEKTNHSDQLLQITAQETRTELKALYKPYSLIKYLIPQYFKERFDLLEWSKYRYIMIKNIFTLTIRSDHFKLHLNGKEIIFNYYSLTHILTRHYAQGMKSYDSPKSHFTHTVGHKEIHLFLESIFNLIDNSNLYLTQLIEEINFRYRGILYKVFCAIEKTHQKGQIINYYRLNSFFPVDNEHMISRLSSEFNEVKINEELNVFIKKQNNISKKSPI